MKRTKGGEERRIAKINQKIITRIENTITLKVDGHFTFFLDK